MNGSKGPGVSCPDCLGATLIKSTRREGQGLRRRRRCSGCGLVFTTREEPVTDEPALVQQRQAAAEIARRYTALGRAGRATVSHLISAIEEAELRGARHEHAAMTAEAAAATDTASPVRDRPGRTLPMESN